METKKVTFVNEALVLMNNRMFWSLFFFSSFQYMASFKEWLINYVEKPVDN